MNTLKLCARIGNKKLDFSGLDLEKQTQKKINVYYVAFKWFCRIAVFFFECENIKFNVH